MKKSKINKKRLLLITVGIILTLWAAPFVVINSLYILTFILTAGKEYGLGINTLSPLIIIFYLAPLLVLLSGTYYLWLWAKKKEIKKAVNKALIVHAISIGLGSFLILMGISSCIKEGGSLCLLGGLDLMFFVIPLATIGTIMLTVSILRDYFKK